MQRTTSSATMHTSRQTKTSTGRHGHHQAWQLRNRAQLQGRADSKEPWQPEQPHRHEKAAAAVSQKLCELILQAAIWGVGCRQ